MTINNKFAYIWIIAPPLLGESYSAQMDLFIDFHMTKVKLRHCADKVLDN